MTERLSIGGRLVARNTALNLLGRGLPLIAAVVAVPILVEELGVERFGVLATTWIVLGYFRRLGVGRATVKYVAEVLAEGDAEQLAAVTWATVAMQAVFGLGCAALLVAATPFLVEHVFQIPAPLLAEARTSFYVLAAIVPVALLTGCMYGVLQAGQRFDLLNAVHVPSTTAKFLLPVVAVTVGWGLPGILGLVLAAQALTLAAYYALSARVYPVLRARPRFRGADVRQLAGFSGWVSASGILAPAFLYLDRILLGALVGMGAVAYYTPAFELVIRMLIIPGSLAAVLFPAFSTLSRGTDPARLERLLSRSVKYVIIVLGPLLVLVAAAAPDILRLWLGPEFVRQSTAALRILAAGLLFNALAHLPFQLIHGLGRPDLTVKLHLVELPLQLLLAWVLISAWGITGAALAWSIRVTVDAGLLFAIAARLAPVSLRSLAEARAPQTAGLVVAFGVVAVAAASWVQTLWLRAGLLALLLAGVAAVLWQYSLGSRDRARLVGWVQRPVRS